MNASAARRHWQAVSIVVTQGYRSGALKIVLQDIKSTQVHDNAESGVRITSAPGTAGSRAARNSVKTKQIMLPIKVFDGFQPAY